MAHQNHRGWLNNQDRGILAAVYNGAQHGTRVLGSNTSLDGVLVGTPVTPALAVDSLVISNLVASGDILLAANNGGNSQAWLWVDSSGGTMTLYAAGVEQMRTASGAMVFNEGSADVDFRVETNGIQYAIYADGGKDALVLGSNTDTSSVDQLITISRAARTATANTAYYDVRVAPAGAVTVPAGTTALVATMSLVEPNITSTGTTTRAATLHIASQPTEGGTANAAIYFGAAANIAGTTSLTINDDGEDLDFRIESADIAYALYVDGVKNALVLGSNTDTSSADQLITVSRAARTATASANYFDLALAPAGAVTVTGATTSAIVGSVSLAEPNITATGTVTNATTLYIASQPTEGGTTNSAIYFGAAANIAGTTSITFNEDSQDVDFRIESNDNANMFALDAGLNAIGIGGAAVTSQTVTIANAALNATAGRVLKLSGTVAAPNFGDGYGAFEVDITASGTVAGTTAASSTWLNIAASAVPGSNLICAQNNGIWLDNGITATNAIMVIGARMQYVPADGADCSNIHLFDTNIYDNVLKSLFRVNAIGDMGGSTGAQTGNDYKVPLFYDVTAGQLWYVNIYHT